MIKDLSMGAKIQFWTAVGPLLLVAALSIALIEFSPANVPLVLASCIALFLCWKWRVRGLIFGLLVLVTTLAFAKPAAWQLGLSVALAVGLLVTALALQEAASFITAFEEERKSYRDDLERVQGHLKEIQLFAIEEKKIAEKKIETLQHELAEYAQLLTHLNDARVEKYQLSLLSEMNRLQNIEKEGMVKALKEELERMSEELQRVKTIPVPAEPQPDDDVQLLCKQLKQQFEEKSAVLNRTRVELFQVEGKLLTLQKENTEQTLGENDYEADLAHHFKTVDAECTHLESEVRHLEALLSALIIKKRTLRPKKPKA